MRKQHTKDMIKAFDVLVVGELNVDLILNRIDKFPEIGKEVLAGDMTLTLGSSSAIFANNISTLGAKVAFAGNLGRDSFGDQILSALTSRGIDTRFIHRRAGENTGASIILSVGEDRAVVTHPGAMGSLTLDDIPPDALQRSGHLHVSSVFLQPGLLPRVGELFRAAKSSGLTTSLDPQWDPAERWDLDLEHLLPAVDLFMPNLRELQALTRTQDLEQGLRVLAPFAHTVVVKCASDGAYLWDGFALHHQPAFLNRAVVDSIGAGDSFNAGFVWQYLQKSPYQKCLEFAALTGAINTTRPGGTNAFENLGLVRAIAGESFNYTF